MNTNLLALLALALSGCIVVPIPSPPPFGDELAWLESQPHADLMRKDILLHLGVPQVVRDEERVLVYQADRLTWVWMIATQGGGDSGSIRENSALVIEVDELGGVTAFDRVDGSERGRVHRLPSGRGVIHICDRSGHAPLSRETRQCTGGLFAPRLGSVIIASKEVKIDAMRPPTLATGCRVYVIPGAALAGVEVDGSDATVIDEHGFGVWDLEEGPHEISAFELAGRMPPAQARTRFECADGRPRFWVGEFSLTLRDWRELSELREVNEREGREALKGHHLVLQ